MVDARRLEQILEHLWGAMAELDRLAALERAALLGDPDRLASVKYHFVVAIECCIDLAHHVIASEGLRAPRDYADAFAVLVESGFVSEEVARPMRFAARFRNRLVHLYWEVEAALVAQYLEENRNDLRAYGRAVAALAAD